MISKEIMHSKRMFGRGINRFFGLLFVFAFLWQSCSGLNRQDSAVNLERPPRDEVFFKELDSAINADGVQERSSFPIDGFPYLRSNRFLAAMKDQIDREVESEFWVEEMLRLGLAARRKEISNLQEKSLHKLAEKTGEKPDRSSLTLRMIKSAERLASHDRQQPNFYQQLIEAIHIPDEYSTSMRILGLYPLVALPVTLAAQNANKKFIKWHQEVKDNLSVEGKLILFRPEYSNEISEEDLALIFSPVRRNSVFGHS